mmetsp:Transcript_7680/g.12956  ORF Transcript_7680/g.12956 Transcript_7680/m.12956 type:complete len:540 (+) Transcript_7680:137-1756(+)
MGRLKKSIVIFVGLCLYERCFYGIFSVLNDFSFNQYFFGFIIFLSCVLFLCMEDSLGFLLHYDDLESGKKHGEVQGENAGEGSGGDLESDALKQQHVYLFGAMDHELLTCFSIPMSFVCGKYRVHVGRLLYYNLHGALFTLAWCGVDSTIGWIMSSLTDWKTGPRIALNFFFLILANCGLISLHQMAGQFGFLGSNADVLEGKATESVQSDREAQSYTPPKVEMQGYKRNDSDVRKNDQVGCAFERSSSSRSEPAPLATYIFVISGVTEDPTVIATLTEDKEFPRYRQLKGGLSFSDNTKRQVKVLLTFICVTTFWSVIWDLFGPMPREQLTSDDDSDDGDDYDTHNLHGSDTQFHVMLVGICYVLVSFMYLAITGELFSFVATEGEEADADSNAEFSPFARWIVRNRRRLMNCFPESIIDKPYNLCGQRVRPYRLLDYNLKGMFCVIAWIGVVFIVISLEDHIVFSQSDDGYAITCAVYLFWLIIANKIFIFYDAFDDQYGAADDEDRPVIELIPQETRRVESETDLDSPLITREKNI